MHSFVGRLYKIGCKSTTSCRWQAVLVLPCHIAWQGVMGGSSHNMMTSISSQYHDKLDLLIAFECGLVPVEHCSHLFIILRVHSADLALINLQCIYTCLPRYWNRLRHATKTFRFGNMPALMSKLLLSSCLQGMRDTCAMQHTCHCMPLDPIIARLNRSSWSVCQHSSRRRTSLMQASMRKQIHKRLPSMYMQSNTCVLHRLARS